MHIALNFFTPYSSTDILLHDYLQVDRRLLHFTPKPYIHRNKLHYSNTSLMFLSSIQPILY